MKSCFPTSLTLMVLCVVSPWVQGKVRWTTYQFYSCLHCRLAHIWHALPAVRSSHRHSARVVWVLHCILINWYLQFWIDVRPN